MDHGIYGWGLWVIQSGRRWTPGRLERKNSTATLGLETAGSGITCNAICSGWVRTEVVEKQIVAHAERLGLPLEAAAVGLLVEKQPSQQFVTVEQIGQLAVFLCSDAAARITGAALPIDGGWTAQ